LKLIAAITDIATSYINNTAVSDSNQKGPYREFRSLSGKFDAADVFAVFLR
jgi:hypothetical protein